MMLRKVKFIALAAFVAASGVATAEEKTTTIPLIPVEAVLEEKEPEKEPVAQGELKPIVIDMKPGINEIVAIAKGHLNRIVTPFDSPKVATVSNATITTSENIIYVATEDVAPVTLFITQKDSENASLSLTLVPKKIPPQEIYLNSGLAGAPMMTGTGTNNAAFNAGAGLVNKRAERWETNHKYVDTIKKVVVSLAKGELPDGYQMSPLANVASVLPQPYCEQPGIQFDWANAQAMFGHHLNVVVGIARNVGNSPVELLPNPCQAVAAFSSWPEVYLQPGEKTEVYIVRKQNETRQVRTKRPSLLSH